MFYPKATFFIEEESSCANILTTYVLSLLCLLLLTGAHCWWEKALGGDVCLFVIWCICLLPYLVLYHITDTTERSFESIFFAVAKQGDQQAWNVSCVCL